MNLYTRINDNDLCKYLSSEQERIINSIAEKISLTMNQYLVSKGEDVSSLIIVVTGELIMENGSGERLGNFLSTNELCCEDYYISPKPAYYNIKTTTASELLTYDFSKIDSLIQNDKELSSRIYAAINDSLSLKTVRLTYKS